MKKSVLVHCGDNQTLFESKNREISEAPSRIFQREYPLRLRIDVI